MDKLGIQNMEEKKRQTAGFLSLLRSSRVGCAAREIIIEAEKLEKCQTQKREN